MTQPFVVERTITLPQTDAVGIMYYAQIFTLAQEALESYLDSLGLPIAGQLAEEPFLLPVVHAEADYFLPLRLGERIRIQVQPAKTGAKSLTLTYEFVNSRGQRAAAVRIVHAAVSKRDFQSIPLPEKIRERMSPTHRA